MSTSKVIYLNELRTGAVHLASGNSINTDAPLDNHGKGENFSPTDLAATSLGCCMLTVLGIHADKKEIDIKDSHAEITKIMSSEGPRRIVQIDVELRIVTPNELDNTEKSLFENIARTCPVALSLHPDLRQGISISFQSTGN